MSGKLTAQEALIYVMVTISAAEGTINDDEIAEIGMLVRTLPVFSTFDTAHLVSTAEACGEILANDADGLEKVLDMIADAPMNPWPKPVAPFRLPVDIDGNGWEDEPTFIVPATKATR